MARQSLQPRASRSAYTDTYVRPDYVFDFVNSAPTGSANGVLWYNAAARMLWISTDTDADAEYGISVNLAGVNATNYWDYIIP